MKLSKDSLFASGLAVAFVAAAAVEFMPAFGIAAKAQADRATAQQQQAPANAKKNIPHTWGCGPIGGCR